MLNNLSKSFISIFFKQLGKAKTNRGLKFRYILNKLMAIKTRVFSRIFLSSFFWYNKNETFEWYVMFFWYFYTPPFTFHPFKLFASRLFFVRIGCHKSFIPLKRDILFKRCLMLNLKNSDVYCNVTRMFRDRQKALFYFQKLF